MTFRPVHPVIELGVIPIVVHDAATAKRAGAMVEQMVIAALDARQRDAKRMQGAAE